MRSKSTVILRPDEAYMQSLSLDEYADLMLKDRRYDVDVETGAVTGLRRGRPLKATPGDSGYPTVYLAYSKHVDRPIRVHRLIAVKLWGVEEIFGKEVAHLDHRRNNNVQSNLQLMTYAEHREYDGTTKAARAAKRIKYLSGVRTTRVPRKPKEPKIVKSRTVARPVRPPRPETPPPAKHPERRRTEWPPCAVCGDPNGKNAPGCWTPQRRSGARFGVEGLLCVRCYRRLQMRKRMAEGYISPARRKTVPA